MSNIENKIGGSFETARKTIYAKALAELAKQTKEEGSENVLHDVVEKYLETLNLELVYESEENNQQIEEMRHKLNTESGIIIANHPGYFDVLAILHLIKRQDIKIIASHFSEISEVFGPEKFLPAVHDPVAIIKQMKEIKSHVESGGVLLIFPTGGQDAVNKPADRRRFEFRSGFRFLIEKVLGPEDMVYSFNIDPGDMIEIASESIPRPIASNSAVFMDINPNNSKERKKIRVRENYSTVAEWSDAVIGVDRQSANQKLAQHYLEKFETK